MESVHGPPPAERGVPSYFGEDVRRDFGGYTLDKFAPGQQIRVVVRDKLASDFPAAGSLKLVSVNLRQAAETCEVQLHQQRLDWNEVVAAFKARGVSLVSCGYPFTITNKKAGARLTFRTFWPGQTVEVIIHRDNEPLIHVDVSKSLQTGRVQQVKPSLLYKLGLLKLDSWVHKLLWRLQGIRLQPLTRDMIVTTGGNTLDLL
ncbi:hypothetical protein WJX72_000219 [[Myrmecia] bisecta]|uniref:Uncharacterized protein n=1 Tax=[Myrmecia] bisecta TaxID=41462 RepID=A0AAW1R3D7_9CHLO